MEDLLNEQRTLEQQEINRLREERERQFVDRFVCGESYARAEEDCNTILWDDAVGLGDGGGVPQNTAATYCPTGVSSTCPTSQKCYAAVSCPRLYHDAEPEILIMDTSLRVLELYAVQYYDGQTEALLDLDVNVTASYVRTFAELESGRLEGEVVSSSLESWRSIPSLMMGAMSSLLPSGIFASSSSTHHDPLDNLFSVGVNAKEVEDVKKPKDSTADGVSIQMLEAAVQRRVSLSFGGRKMI
jgi:hypothetical protein